jgi:hypothetical protein
VRRREAGIASVSDPGYDYKLHFVDHGRGCGVGRGLGDGVDLGVGAGVGVPPWQLPSTL